MFAAWAEQFVGKKLSRLVWIGENTYGLYLWHVPVQIALLLMISDKSVFATPAFLLAWLAGMMVLARLSFLFIETPLRWRITAANNRDYSLQGNRSEPSP